MLSPPIVFMRLIRSRSDATYAARLITGKALFFGCFYENEDGFNLFMVFIWNLYAIFKLVILKLPATNLSLNILMLSPFCSSPNV